MRGATPGHRSFASTPRISIHAPHARSDYPVSRAGRHGTDFNPRSSCEERHHGKSQSRKSRISIHAPHARSDKTPQYKCASRRNFNPRSSCEERRRHDCHPGAEKQFQSTLLMRGATQADSKRHTGVKFQSTLLMRGATTVTPDAPAMFSFQSTLLMRGATCFYRLNVIPHGISIHAPHARSDLMWSRQTR